MSYFHVHCAGLPRRRGRALLTPGVLPLQGPVLTPMIRVSVLHSPQLMHRITSISMTKRDVQYH